jgi:hypothetical protein
MLWMQDSDDTAAGSRLRGGSLEDVTDHADLVWSLLGVGMPPEFDDDDDVVADLDDEDDVVATAVNVEVDDGVRMQPIPPAAAGTRPQRPPRNSVAYFVENGEKSIFQGSCMTVMQAAYMEGASCGAELFLRQTAQAHVCSDARISLFSRVRTKHPAAREHMGCNPLLKYCCHVHLRIRVAHNLYLQIVLFDEGDNANKVV